MSNVCFIDTETLGLDPDHNPVWEVGLILPDGTEREWQIEVTPREQSLAHPIALEVSHFKERYNITRPADTPYAVARDLSDLIPERCHLAGAVVSFDEERLRRLLWGHGFAPPWHYHLIDVETLAVGWLAAGRDSGWTPEWPADKCTPPWDSEELSRALGVEPDRFERHTALGDARWAKAMYEAAMGYPFGWGDNGA